MTWLKLALVLVFLGAGAAGVYFYNSAITRAETAEAAVAEHKKAAEAWKEKANAQAKDRRKAEQLLAQEREQRRIEQARGDVLAGKLAALEAANELAGAQLRTAVHPDIRRLRRTTAGCPDDLSVRCPPLPPGAPTGAPDERHDVGRADPGERRSPVSVPPS